jgi:PAS domain S-box-containing protein
MDKPYENMSKSELLEEIRILKSEIANISAEQNNIYEDLFPNAGYIILDQYGTIVRANSTASAMLNSEGNLQGKPFEYFLVQEDLRKFTEHFKKLNNGSKKELLEFRIAADNDVIFFLGEIIPVAANAKNDTEYRMVLVNVSERKMLEDQVHTNEKQLQAIFNQVIVGIIQIDLNGNFLMVNRKFCEILGRTESELLRMNIKDITYQDDIAQKLELLNSLTPGNPFITYQKRYVTADNKIVWVHNSMTLVTDQYGRRQYAVALVEDISDRIKVEESLKKSLKELSDYKYAIDESSIVAITDQRGIIKYANDNFCKISKYSRGELLGKDHRIINSGFHSKDFIKNIWTTIASGKIWKGELKNRAKDGTTYWVDTTIIPFLNERNKPYQYVAIRSDITQKKLAEEQLKESEERFKMMADTTPAFIWMTDSLGAVNYMNKTRVEFCGGTLIEQLDDNWLKFIHPEDKERVKTAGKEANKKRRKFQVEYRLRYNDGSYRWILDSGHPRFSSDGDFLGFIGSGIDINEIKDAEAKLKESYEREKKLRITTEEGERKLSFIAEATTILNSSLDYSLTLKSLAHMATPEIADWCIVDLYNEASNELNRVAISHVNPDNIDLANYIRDTYNKNLKELSGVWHVLKSGSSVLYKEVSQESLRKLAVDEEHYNILASLKMVSGMIVPLKIREKVFGTITLIYAESNRHYNDEDLHFVEDLASRAALAIDNARLYNESQALNRNLEERVKELQFEIQERIKARKDLLASEERFRQLAENINNVFFIIDYETGGVVYLSPAFEMIWGISAAEVYNEPARWLEVIHPEDRGKINGLKGARFMFEQFNQEFRIIKPGGKERWIHTKSFPVANETGEIYRVVGVTEDITQRKVSEEQIKQSLREKEVLLREIHHRVKNNLQIISSLLSLQTPNIKNKQDLEIFLDSQNRIRSMALVHEKLYQRKDLSGINLEEYVKDLTGILKESYRVKAELVDFDIEADDIMLNVDMSIGLGLIINELVSNAFKHAFPDNRRGAIKIRIKTGENDSLHLKISDNGVGFPEHIDFKNTESLGLQLVTTLVDQHWGKIELFRNDGTKYKISFPDVKAR